MDVNDNAELIDYVRSVNNEYRRIEKIHHKLDEDLKKMDGRYLTPDEEMLKKNMQKDKLIKKDRMTQILRDYMEKIKTQ
ncbi:MAG: DUF465 domain-containing protein [Nitrospirae bacterium]|nr:DUF465 domain-containing protein [Nitrospirota bacterium]